LKNIVPDQFVAGRPVAGCNFQQNVETPYRFREFGDTL
jgi:hypothetical protein